MTWEFFKVLAETAMTIVGYALFVGAGVTGVVFVGAFMLWLYDRVRKEMCE
jgi:isoprenylcysteine carboxyl methyltransferase (ICMT) family protein YpbQ